MKSQESASRLKIKTLVTALSFISTLSCVTVNVNFPESAVQEATDNYVKDIYRTKSKGHESPSNPPDKQVHSSLNSVFSLIPNAYADTSLVFQIKSSKALEIQKRLAERSDEVLAQKKQGIIGETSDGLLSIRSSGQLKPLQAKRVEALVSEENKDREELYEEVLRANSISQSRMKDLKHSFARSFQSESPAGTWVQDSSGGWAKK